ncbi:MAG: hypothetical protein JWM21_1938 [Acidobacteria bacterium]|jgi:hypothetical protein|nr:hypothetical protein [Acidobacteriota bacterium]
MNCKHIINLIEQTPFSDITDSDRGAIRAHAAVCEACNQAWQATQISALLLKERVAATFEPTPFFQTRVLAAMREQQNEQWSWAKMWRATGALASSMVATVAAIAVLTFVIPGTSVDSTSELTSTNNTYSAEEVILNQGEVAGTQTDPVSDAQVLTTLYGSEEEK